MRIRTLLMTAAVVAAGGMAIAADNYSIYPEPGSELDDCYYLQNISITPTSPDFTVSEFAYAFIECNETGDEYYSSEFIKFDAGECILVKFEDAQFVQNGSYTLTIPAGQFTIAGTANDKITVDYTLNDPNLNLGDFPQIELLSADPADGSKFPAWGDAIGKIRFQTSDDAAVNYIEWTLWDVTDYETYGMRDWITAGNENRIDLNRYGTTDDQWADGLWVSLSGDEKLIKDHKYELEVTFCGIGYDPETNQYPTPQQINGSKELQTSIYYYGLTPATEYSPYIVEEVTPDPWMHTIVTAEQGKFTVKYSGPVKPVQFTYPLGMGAGTATAGTFEAAGTTDADGCCDIWDFTMSPDVLEAASGMLTVMLRAQDKDGLYVKGNSFTTFDDFDYQISWLVRVGLNELSSVFPENNATVTELNEIVIGNHAYGKPGQGSKAMNPSYLSWGPATISVQYGEEVRVLGEPVRVEGDNTVMKWQFDAITEPGTYVLYIPDTYFNFGEEFDGAGSNLETYFTYTVSDEGAVQSLHEDGRTFNVVNINGVTVKRNASDLSGLPAGIYIVNGKKVIL